MAPRPPERFELDGAVLRRHRLDDAKGIAEAVAASLDHLRPWMPWATEDTATEAFQHQRLVEVVPHWETDVDYAYVLVPPDDTAVLACVGLHRRIGPGAIEIGYWVHTAHAGRGLATAAAGALTAAALELDGIERVEIHCDEANARSAAVPERLGYTLDRVEPDEITAPGECGRSMVWVKTLEPGVARST